MKAFGRFQTCKECKPAPTRAFDVEFGLKTPWFSGCEHHHVECQSAFVMLCYGCKPKQSFLLTRCGRGAGCKNLLHVVSIDAGDEIKVRNELDFSLNRA